jgi:hypothetical protein
VIWEGDRPRATTRRTTLCGIRVAELVVFPEKHLSESVPIWAHSSIPHFELRMRCYKRLSELCNEERAWRTYHVAKAN